MQMNHIFIGIEKIENNHEFHAYFSPYIHARMLINSTSDQCTCVMTLFAINLEKQKKNTISLKVRIK